MDSNNGNSDIIDDKVIVVPNIRTVLDKANLNDIDVSVSPTNLTQTKLNSEKNSNQLKELMLV